MWLDKDERGTRADGAHVESKAVFVFVFNIHIMLSLQAADADRSLTAAIAQVSHARVRAALSAALSRR